MFLSLVTIHLYEKLTNEIRIEYPVFIAPQVSSYVLAHSQKK